MSVPVTIMITSRNRCVDLRHTLSRLADLNPPPAEILVTADGCQDGTEEMIQREFTKCLLTVNKTGKGSVGSRDAMIRKAKHEFILSLDDDSYPVENGFLGGLSEFFSKRPEVSVVTFPELRDDGQYVPADKSPASSGRYVSAYPNGAAAMRRSDYLQTQGFPSFFVHAYEEPDYALQVYELGRAVWFEPGLVIRHHCSAVNRNALSTHHFNARNELWSVWIRCPWFLLLPVMMYRLARQFVYSCSQGMEWVFQEPRWWWRAIVGLRQCLAVRKPVRGQVYLAWMRLARRPIYHGNRLWQTFGWQEERSSDIPEHARMESKST